MMLPNNTGDIELGGFCPDSNPHHTTGGNRQNLSVPPWKILPLNTAVSHAAKPWAEHHLHHPSKNNVESAVLILHFSKNVVINCIFEKNVNLVNKGENSTIALLHYFWHSSVLYIITLLT